MLLLPQEEEVDQVPTLGGVETEQHGVHAMVVSRVDVSQLFLNEESFAVNLKVLLLLVNDEYPQF